MNEDNKKRKKTGGRKAGTPNKVSKDLRSRISGFLDENWDEAIEAWKKIKDSKDKVKLYVDLIHFVVPKLQAIDIDASVRKEENSIEEDLEMLANS